MDKQFVRKKVAFLRKAGNREHKQSFNRYYFKAPLIGYSLQYQTNAKKIRLPRSIY